MYILGAWMAHLWERLPLINAARSWNPVPSSQVIEFAIGSHLAPSIFLRLLRFSSILKNTTSSDWISKKAPFRRMYHCLDESQLFRFNHFCKFLLSFLFSIFRHFEPKMLFKCYFPFWKNKRKKLTWPALWSAFKLYVFIYTSVSFDDYMQYYYCSIFFPADISFITAVTFTEEKFYTDILNMNSKTFKQLEKKIEYNVSLIDSKFNFSQQYLYIV